MNLTPLYASKCKAKSFWQEYKIFTDRLEFDTLLGKMTVPFDSIEKITVEESDLKGLMHGNLHLKDFRPALKLDWANFTEHIVLDRSSGQISRILFTPDDPQTFHQELNSALQQYHSQK